MHAQPIVVLIEFRIQPGKESLATQVMTSLIATVRSRIGPIATPDAIEWAPRLPKNRSGKILRRILTRIAAGDFENHGDTSTVAEPAVIDELVARRKSAG